MTARKLQASNKQKTVPARRMYTLALFLCFERFPLTLELLRLRKQVFDDALLAVHMARRCCHGLHRRVNTEGAMPERLLRVSA